MAFLFNQLYFWLFKCSTFINIYLSSKIGKVWSTPPAQPIIRKKKSLLIFSLDFEAFNSPLSLRSWNIFIHVQTSDISAHSESHWIFLVLVRLELQWGLLTSQSLWLSITTARGLREPQKVSSNVSLKLCHPFSSLFPTELIHFQLFSCSGVKFLPVPLDPPIPSKSQILVSVVLITVTY